MSDTRRINSWLLLGLLTVVGVGAAVIGIVQSPKTAPLYACTGSQKGPTCSGAVANTLAAPNYTEVLTESTARGKQTDYLVYQAPDRLGGYVQSGNKRRYVVVIGKYEYQTLAVAANASTNHLTFYRQQISGGAKNLDPVRGYLPYVYQSKNITQAGDTYSFSLTKGGQTGSFTYTVTGQYVSEFTLTVSSGSVRLDISQVGSSPPVSLPAGAKVVGVPTGLG